MIRAVRDRIKFWLHRRAPGLLVYLRARRNHMRRTRLVSIIDRLTVERGFVVQSGPFKGMAYLSEAQFYDSIFELPMVVRDTQDSTVIICAQEELLCARAIELKV